MHVGRADGEQPALGLADRPALGEEIGRDDSVAPAKGLGERPGFGDGLGPGMEVRPRPSTALAGSVGMILRY